MNLQTIKTVSELRAKLQNKEIGSIALVPTMGFLHDGHLSLIEKALQENDTVVVSIFVNPIQFGPNEDFATYPRDLEADTAKISKLINSNDEFNIKTVVVFNPEPSELYSDDFSTTVVPSALTNILCGARRPGHFEGVTTVVCKLFNIVQPKRAYFGQKDAQQVAVINRMVRDLNIPVEIIPCPIIRESDGLAMSSRNTYLSEKERQSALILSKALNLLPSKIPSDHSEILRILDEMKTLVKSEPLATLDYLDLVPFEELPVKKGKSLIALAVFIGEGEKRTRLIDNRLVTQL